MTRSVEGIYVKYNYLDIESRLYNFGSIIAHRDMRECSTFAAFISETRYLQCTGRIRRVGKIRSSPTSAWIVQTCSRLANMLKYNLKNGHHFDMDFMKDAAVIYCRRQRRRRRSLFWTSTYIGFFKRPLVDATSLPGVEPTRGVDYLTSWVSRASYFPPLDEYAQVNKSVVISGRHR